jgi:hypothetical protein
MFEKPNEPGKRTVLIEGDDPFTPEKSTSHMGESEPGAQPLAGQQKAQKQGAQEKSAAQKQDEQKMDAALAALVDTQKLTGSAFTHISRCKKCGWQTMQMDEESGAALVKKHAAAHWPELRADQAQEQSASNGGAEPAKDAKQGSAGAGQGELDKDKSKPSAQKTAKP